MKNKGGRGHKSSHESSVIRVPDPIKPQILALVEEFYGETQKPVTGLELLPATFVSDWYITSLPTSPQHDAPTTLCYTTDPNEWCDEWWYESGQAEKVEAWLKLSDRINRVLLQIDNTQRCGDPGTFSSGIENSYEILERLVKHHLIYLDVQVDPWTFNQIFDYAENELDGGSWRPSELKARIIEYAFEQRNWAVLAAFELGKESPPNRQEYWHKTYKEQLGKKNINYWDWLPNPESREVCEELTVLLSLPEPSGLAHAVLRAMSEGRNPFEAVKEPIPLGDLFNLPKFARVEEPRRQALRNAFREWHYTTLDIIGQEMLERIYQTCYNFSWEILEAVFYNFTGTWHEILGVAATADHATVKASWRGLAKKFHPDVNSNGAWQMIAINNAWDEFQKIWETQQQHFAYKAKPKRKSH